MALTVHTNVTSLSAQRNLGNTHFQMQQSINRLSSGYRINRAADDAAGLAISEEMKADLRSITQASRNADDAISLLQTAEGGMNDITGMLHRLRELSMQSVSDGVTDTQRGYINTEATQLLEEIDRISAETEFNGRTCLDGTLDLDFQIGLDSGDIINVALATALDTAGMGIAGLDLSTKAGSDTALGLVDTALTNLSTYRAEIGAKENRMEVIKSNLGVTHENLSAANSRIRDVDVAEEMTVLTKNQILMQVGTSMLAQANQVPQAALSLLGG